MMKKKFRGLAVLLSAIVIVVGALSACSNQNGDKSDDTKQSTEENTEK